MRKNRKWIIIGIILIFLLIIYSSVRNTYNQMVALSESVEKQWSDVENQFQRRADLIPNLVNTVKGYADFEQETLTEVIEARSKATSVNINPENLTSESLQQFQQVQAGLSGALSRLLVVIERYPDLKANQNFLELQAQLEGTENRISVERRKFNESTRAYNTYIKQFPKNIYAGIFNFDARPYFEAEQGSEVTPKVEF
ncbi:LemA family protein [Bacteroidota bacterium]